MSHMEIEVKFFLEDKAAVRQRILALGAVSQGERFETNIRFEDRDKSLIKRNVLLRLRKDNQATLTLKSPPEIADTEFKVYREIETQVSDFENTKQILAGLGFLPEQVYEKWRETFTAGPVVLCLDTLPYGDFLEIEADKESIRQWAEKLGLAWENRLVTNYLGMFARIREKYGLAFTDVTFENFEGISVDSKIFLGKG